MPIDPGYNPVDVQKLIQQFGNRMAPAHPSADFLTTPIEFNANDENYKRYANSDYGKELGFVPGRDNEEMYGQRQTFGNMMANAFEGAGALAKLTFADGWRGWGRMYDAVSTMDWTKLYQDSPEELEKRNNQQSRVFDEYPIFQTEHSRNTLLNRQFFGNMLQQAGFSIGTLGQALTEETLVQLAAAGLAATGVGAEAGVGLEAAEQVKEASNIAKMFSALKKVGDIYQDGSIFKKLFKGGTGSLYDIYRASKEGATTGELAKMGFGTLYRTLREGNMAMTEARMEGANTYGQMKGDLINQFVQAHGRTPNTQELKDIEDYTGKAASSNFLINSAIIAVSNRLEFDNIIKGWRPTSRLAREAEEAGERIFTVTGNSEGKRLTKAFEEGFGGVGEAWKTFGWKQGLWQGLKYVGKPILKIETTEGVQEVAQDLSDASARDYYTNLYRMNNGEGGTSSKWQSFKNAVHQEGWRQGAQTFLMGALTGGIMSPINFAVGKVQEMAHKQDYQRVRAERRENIDQLNTLLKDPGQVLNESVAHANQMKDLSVGLSQAVKDKSQHDFESIKDTAFYKMVSHGMKTGKLDSLLDTLKDYAANLTPKEVQAAFPGFSEDDFHTHVGKLVGRAQEVRDAWDKIHERFTNPFNPSKYKSGTPKWMEEWFNRDAFEKVKDDLAFSKFATQRAKERYTSLLEGVAQDKNIGAELFPTFNTLTSKPNLEQHIKNLKESTDPSEQKQASMYEAWADYLREVNPDPKKGIALFAKILSEGTKERGATSRVTQDDIEQHFNTLQDILKLQDEATEHMNKVNFLVNPKGFKSFYLKTRKAVEEAYNTIKEEKTQISDVERERMRASKRQTTPPDETKGKYDTVARAKFRRDKRVYSELVSQYGEGTQSLRATLQKIVSSPYAIKAEKELAAKFLEFIKEDETINLGNRNINSAGSYSISTKQIDINYESAAYDYVNGAHPVETVILHEVGHKLTVDALRNDPEFKAEITKLLEVAKKHYEDNRDEIDGPKGSNLPFYGLKDEDEFVTEALSSLRFQGQLSRIAYKNTKKSTWEKFLTTLKDMLRRLFVKYLGAEEKVDETLLDEAIGVITNQIDKLDRYKPETTKTAIVPETNPTEVEEEKTKVDPRYLEEVEELVDEIEGIDKLTPNMEKFIKKTGVSGGIDALRAIENVIASAIGGQDGVYDFQLKRLLEKIDTKIRLMTTAAIKELKLERYVNRILPQAVADTEFMSRLAQSFETWKGQVFQTIAGKFWTIDDLWGAVYQELLDWRNIQVAKINEELAKNRALTQSAIDLLKSIDEGSKPAFITKNLEQIAKDNGIIVTDTTTPDEIIEALRAKQSQKTVVEFPQEEKNDYIKQIRDAASQKELDEVLSKMPEGDRIALHAIVQVKVNYFKEVAAQKRLLVMNEIHIPGVESPFYWRYTRAAGLEIVNNQAQDYTPTSPHYNTLLENILTQQKIFEILPREIQQELLISIMPYKATSDDGTLELLRASMSSQLRVLPSRELAKKLIDKITSLFSPEDIEVMYQHYQQSNTKSDEVLGKALQAFFEDNSIMDDANQVDWEKALEKAKNDPYFKTALSEDEYKDFLNYIQSEYDKNKEASKAPVAADVSLGDAQKLIEEDRERQKLLTQIAEDVVHQLYLKKREQTDRSYSQRFGRLQTTTEEDKPDPKNPEIPLLFTDPEMQRKYRIKRNDKNVDFDQQDRFFLIIHDTPENQQKYGYLYERDEPDFKTENPGYKAVVALMVDENGTPVKFNQDGEQDEKGNAVIFTLPSSFNQVTGRFEQESADRPIMGLTWADFKNKVLQEKQSYLVRIKRLSTGAIQALYEDKYNYPTREAIKHAKGQIHIVVAKSQIITHPVTRRASQVAQKYEDSAGATYMYVGDNGYPISINPKFWSELPDLLENVMSVIREITDPTVAKDSGHVWEMVQWLETLIHNKKNDEIRIFFRPGKDNPTNTAEFRFKNVPVTSFTEMYDYLRVRRMQISAPNTTIETPFHIYEGIGKVVATYPSYKSFVLDNSTTKMLLDMDGHPLSYNRFYEFYAPKEYKQEQKVVEQKKQETPAEQRLREREERDAKKRAERRAKRGDEGDKERSKLLPVTDIPISSDDLLWFKKTFFRTMGGKQALTGFEHRGIKHLATLANSTAWARWKASGIILYKGADKGTLYHEAWHEFTQLYLTKAQKDELYQEAQKVFGENKSQKELEEKLAEGFRDFIAQPQEPKTFLQRAYQFIKDILSHLFGPRKEGAQYIDEMYNKLRRGKINNYEPSFDNMEFGELNRAITDKDGNLILNAADAYLSVQTIDYLLYSFIKEQSVAITRTLSDSKKNKDLLADMYMDVRDSLQSRKEYFEDEAEQPENQEKRDDYLSRAAELGKMLDNWEYIVEHHVANTPTFKVKAGKYIVLTDGTVKREETAVEPSVTVPEDEESQPTDEGSAKGTDEEKEGATKYSFEGKSGNEVSSIDGANRETRALIRGLTKKQVDKDGKVRVYENKWKFNQLVDFSRTWNTLANNLEGTLKYSGMISKLNDLKGRFPEYEELLSMLPTNKQAEQLGANEKTILQPENLSRFDVSQITKFWQDFCRTKIGLYETLIEGQEDNDIRQLIFKFTESTKNNVDAVRKDFVTNFIMAGDSPWLEHTADGSNKLLSTIAENGESAIYNYFGNKLANEANRLEFLRVLGIELSDEAVKDRRSFNTNVGAEDVLKILEYLNDGLKRGIDITDPINQLSQDKWGTGARTSDAEKGQYARIGSIIRYEAKYSIAHASLSMRNAEGNLQYALSLNNYITVINAVLSDYYSFPKFTDVMNNPWMKHLDPRNNPYMKNSLWLNTMFDLTGDEATNENWGNRKKIGGEFVTLTLGNYNGIKYENNRGVASEGDLSTGMYIWDKMLMDINNMFNGVCPLMRTGDKASEFFAGLSGYISSKGTESKTPVALEEFSSSFNSKDFLGKMRGYLVDELERIKLFNNPQYPGHSLNKYKDTGKKLSLFRDILGTNKTSLGAEVVDRINAGEDPTTVVNSLDRRINDAVIIFFEGQFQHLSRRLAETMMVQGGSNAWIHPDLLAKSEYNTSAILRAFLANQFIYHIEQSKFFFGDGTFYDHKEGEGHKRFPAMTATGTLLLQEDWLDTWHELQNSKLKLADSQKWRTGQGDEKNIVNTAVLKDVATRSVYRDLWYKYLTENGTSHKEAAELLGKYGYLTPQDEAAGKKPEKYEETDAQGYITLPFYRYYKITQGKWYDRHNDIYEKVMRGEELTKEEEFYFMPLKAQYGGPMNVPGVYAPAFHKFSLMPLIPHMIKGTPLEKVNNLMMKQNIGYSLFKTGSKITDVLNKQGQNDNFYSDYEDGEALHDDYLFTKNPIYLNYLKEQVNIEPELHNEVVFATQLRKLTPMNLFDKGKFIGNPNLEKLYNQYVDTVNRLTEIEKQALYDEMGITKNGDKFHISDMAKFAEKVSKEAQARDYNENILEFIDFDKSKNSFTNPLDASVNSYQMQNLIMSMINNRVIRQMISGDLMVQASGAGLERQGRFRKPTDEEIKRYGTNGLRFYYVENGRTRSMQVKVALTGKFANLLNRADVEVVSQERGISKLEALNSLLKDEGWMAKNKQLVTMVGTRVPVQSLNSVEVMEVAEFLDPSAGDLIIVPSELVAKSGSDFDIDKLFTFKPAINKGGSLHIELKEALQNELIRTMSEIITDKDNFKLLISPNSNEQVKPLAEDIRAKTSTGIKHNFTGTDMYTADAQIEKFNSGLVGKRTLGIAATNNPVTQLFIQAGMTLNPTYAEAKAITQRYKDEYSGKMKTRRVGTEFINVPTIINLVKERNSDGSYDFSSLLDEDGVPKSKFTEQMINAYVDTLKDDFIFYANAGINLAGMIFYLKNLGIGTKKIFYFINHPVIRQYAEDESARRSDLIRKMYKDEDTGELLEGFRKAGVPDIGRSLGEYIRILITQGDSRLRLALPDNEKALLYVSDGKGGTQLPSGPELHAKIAQVARDHFPGMFTMGHLTGRMDNPKAPMGLLEKIMFLNELQNMKSQSEIVRKAQTTFNFDTKRSATPMDAADTLNTRVVVQQHRLLNEKALDKIRNDSVIASFNVQNFILDLMQEIFPVTGNRQFIDRGLRIANNLFDITPAQRERLLRTYRNDVILYILSNYVPSPSGKGTLGDWVHDEKGMFSNHEGIPGMAEKLSGKPDSMKAKYKREQVFYPFFRNLFLSENKKRDSNVKNIEFFRTDNSTAAQNSYIQEWRDLMNSAEPDLRDFFQDLTKFAYFQSGLNKSPISFTDLIPNEAITDLLRTGVEAYLADVAARGADAVIEEYAKIFETQNRATNPGKFEDDYRFKDYRREGPGGTGLPERAQRSPTPGNQGSLFPTAPEHGITFEEDRTTGYKARTVKNASADATIAIAFGLTPDMLAKPSTQLSAMRKQSPDDLTIPSAGEKLTYDSVIGQSKKYIPVHAKEGLTVTPELINRIVTELNSVNAKTLNIAGNGIYTMKGSYTQAQVDQFTYEILKAVIESPDLKNKITSIRTGGQTGIDEAGAKAGVRLGLPTHILAPKGWKFRNIQGVDISNEAQFKARFAQGVKKTEEEGGSQRQSKIDESKKLLTKDAAENVMSFLKTKFGIAGEIINDPAIRWKGAIVDGKPTINLAYAGLSDAFHEYMHPLLMALKKENPQLFTKLWNQLVYGQSWEEIRHRAISKVMSYYPELTDSVNLDLYREEVMATALGYAAEIRSDEKLENINKHRGLMSWVSDLFKWLNQFLTDFLSKHTKVTELSLDTTLDDIIDWSTDLKHRLVLGESWKSSLNDADLVDIRKQVDEKFQEPELSPVVSQRPSQEEVNALRGEVDKAKKEADEAKAELDRLAKEYEEEPSPRELAIQQLQREIEEFRNESIALDIPKELAKPLRFPKRDFFPRKKLKGELTGEIVDPEGGTPIPTTSKFLEYLKKASNGSTFLNKPFKLENLTDYEREMLEEYRGILNSEVKKWARENRKPIPDKIQNKRLYDKLRSWIDTNYKFEYYRTLAQASPYGMRGGLTPTGQVSKGEGYEVLISNGILSDKGHTYTTVDENQQTMKSGVNSLGWYIYYRNNGKTLLYEFQSDFADGDNKIGSDAVANRMEAIRWVVRNKLGLGLWDEVADNRVVTARQGVKEAQRKVSMYDPMGWVRGNLVAQFFLTNFSTKQRDIIKKIAYNKDSDKAMLNIKKFVGSKYDTMMEALSSYEDDNTITNTSKIIASIKALESSLAHKSGAVDSRTGREYRRALKDLEKANKTYNTVQYQAERNKLLNSDERYQEYLHKWYTAMEKRIKLYYLNNQLDLRIARLSEDMRKLNATWFQKSLLASLMYAKERGDDVVYLPTAELMSNMGDATTPYVTPYDMGQMDVPRQQATSISEIIPDNWHETEDVFTRGRNHQHLFYDSGEHSVSVVRRGYFADRGYNDFYVALDGKADFTKQVMGREVFDLLKPDRDYYMAGVTIRGEDMDYDADVITDNPQIVIGKYNELRKSNSRDYNNLGGVYLALRKIKGISHEIISVPEFNAPVIKVDISNFEPKPIERFSKIAEEGNTPAQADDLTQGIEQGFFDDAIKEKGYDKEALLEEAKTAKTTDDLVQLLKKLC